MDEISRGRQDKKLRGLTLGLIVSCALNIGLVATCILTQMQESDPKLRVQTFAKQKARSETTLDKALIPMQGLSFQTLVSYLTNKEHISDGLTKRDLALASLVSYHHFHIDKVLSGSSIQRRVLPLADGSNIEVFPGLAQSQFDAIIKFAYEEKWPLTAHGLFRILKSDVKKDETFFQAFSVTQEFRLLQVLFQKTQSSQDVSVLLELVKEGSWELLDQFAKEQTQMLDLSIDKRRSLLLSYLAFGSKAAANLLLSTDLHFISKRLEDKGVIGMLSLLENNTKEVQDFCKELLKSPRSDEVWHVAADKLYSFAGESMPVPFSVECVQERFGLLSATAVKSTIVERQDPVIATHSVPKFKEHVVKDGESLWKISRIYSVKVDDIVRVNDMDKDKLFPGMILRIPNSGN